MLDAVTLSSLLASRLCHDLINPVGALGAGLEVMESETDPEMRAEAMRLIQNSTNKSVALLQFARMAFGAGGAFGEELDLEEVKSLLNGIYDHVKADLVWDLPSGTLPKPVAKVLMNMGLVIADCVPRAGSSVRIWRDGHRILLTATGVKARLKDTLEKALAANSDELDAKMTPAFLAALMARKVGCRLEAEQVNEEVVEMRLVLPLAG